MADRIIVLRFDGKCQDCGTVLLAGEKAQYYGQNVISCLNCEGGSDSKKSRVTEVCSRASGQTWTQCDCEDRPACGH